MNMSTRNLPVLSPLGQARLSALKIKANEMPLGDPPKSPRQYLAWRLAALDRDIEQLCITRTFLRGGYRSGLIADRALYEKLRAEAEIAEERLLHEQKEILGRGRSLLQDLEDRAESARSITQAFSKELRSYDQRRKDPCAGPTRKRARQDFENAADQCYGLVEANTWNDSRSRWCMVVGDWVKVHEIRYPHIVPASFGSPELAYLFGTTDEALSSPRNVLSLYDPIAKAFDNGNVAIVPDGSVGATPTEWKMVLLDESMRNHPVGIGQGFNLDKEVPNPKKIIWGDLDSRRLRFRNENRPARRYLFFRYVMSYLAAKEAGRVTLTTKLPEAWDWTCANKSYGYLRRSVLQDLARRVGGEEIDGPTKQLLLAGSFDDTRTEDAGTDKRCVVGLAILLQRQRRGEEKDVCQLADMDEGDEDDSDGEDWTKMTPDDSTGGDD